MASRQQVQQNFNDVNNAWGQLQWFVNVVMPFTRAGLIINKNYLNSRRRFR